jgi:citrate lyase subunit beta/citryl-CoA lyase
MSEMAAAVQAPVVWRSMLFVPAHVARFVDAAHSRSADAYILDLEDSVPLAMKESARRVLSTSLQQVCRSGASALVRVNDAEHGQELDLAAAVAAGASAVVLPKVDDASQVVRAAGTLDRLERQSGGAVGATKLIALIEDVRALPCLDAIAASSARLVGMILGSEDFSASAGMVPIRETLLGPNQQVQFACRRAGLMPFGFPASIAEFSDADALRGHIALARQMGFVGAFCIHPSQVPILNEGFSPSEEEISRAASLVEAFDAAVADGQGAFRFHGKMVDLPVVLRARELLARSSKVARQEKS